MRGTIGDIGWSSPGSSPAAVSVYGTRWCAQTMLIRRHLERLGVPYRYFDLETDPRALAQVRWWTGGSARHPTVAMAGRVLVEPQLRELERALARYGLR